MVVMNDRPHQSRRSFEANDSQKVSKKNESDDVEECNVVKRGGCADRWVFYCNNTTELQYITSEIMSVGVTFSNTIFEEY